MLWVLSSGLSWHCRVRENVCVYGLCLGMVDVGTVKCVLVSLPDGFLLDNVRDGLCPHVLFLFVFYLFKDHAT